MPHVGGGGHSGGFHSSSGSHSSSSTPKYDNHGNLHTPHYVRPGFYIGSRYVPYTSEERKSITNYALSIVLFVLSLGFLLVSAFIIGSKGKYEESTLEYFALDQYSLLYDSKASDYEEKILVTFVTYEDETQYDYVSIVGDNVDSGTDSFFGNEHSEFGSSLLNNIPEEKYFENLYVYLAASLNQVNNEFSTNPLYGNIQATGSHYNSYIIDKANYKTINGENDLKNACDQFYSIRGYDISFLIVDHNEVYPIEWAPVIFLWVISGLFITFGISQAVKTKKDIKIIEKEIKNGNAEKYFEGEDPFEEYYKNHPLE